MTRCIPVAIRDAFVPRRFEVTDVGGAGFLMQMCSSDKDKMLQGVVRLNQNWIYLIFLVIDINFVPSFF